jgi:hypothetical protein
VKLARELCHTDLVALVRIRKKKKKGKTLLIIPNLSSLLQKGTQTF